MAISSNANDIPTKLSIAKSLFLLLTASFSFNGLGILCGQQPTAQSQDSSAIQVPECRISTFNQVSLACERSGVLNAVSQRGSTVRKGEIVAQLRDTIARASLSVAQQEAANDIEIRFAKKASELAQLKYERAKSADRTLSGTVTEFELRELRLAAERSLLQMQQAEHQFEIARLRMEEKVQQLSSFQISAPFDAYVRAANKKPGEFVREGETVVELVNDDIMLVEGFIGYDQVNFISIGSDVSVFSKQNNHEPIEFPGQINFVDNKIDPISMKVRVSALIQNSNSKLKDGFLTTMAISTNRTTRLSRR